VVEFGEWLCQEVIKAVPHRHFVFSIPNPAAGLRRYFLFDRKLLSGLSRCGWESLKLFLQETVPEKETVPGAVIVIQTFGDFLGFNPHLDILDYSYRGVGGPEMESQVPPCEDCPYRDPDYPIEAYAQG